MFRYGRLRFKRPASESLDDMVRIKTDEATFGHMLGGVRSVACVRRELQEERDYWARHDCGIFLVYRDEALVGLAGVHEHPQIVGHCLRYAVLPPFRGGGLGYEMAQGVLEYLHPVLGRDARLSAVVRCDNAPSLKILKKIGMIKNPEKDFRRDGVDMHVLEMNLRV